MRTAASSLPTDISFTGQRSDASTGLLFYNARYYDPVVGRFVSADTVVPEGENPQEWNLYSYVANNPLKYTDPSGHKKCNPDDSSGCGGGGSEGGGGGNGGCNNCPARNFLSREEINRAARQQIEALESKVNIPGKTPHALSKHAPGSDTTLSETAFARPGIAQTRFLNEKEMLSSINETIEQNMSLIESKAIGGKAGQIPLPDGPLANYTGYQVDNGQLRWIFGEAPVKVVIQYDGFGGWGLYTAYPNVFTVPPLP